MRGNKAGGVEWVSDFVKLSSFLVRESREDDTPLLRTRIELHGKHVFLLGCRLGGDRWTNANHP